MKVIVIALMLHAAAPTVTFKFHPSICTEPCRIDGHVNLSEPERTRAICIWITNVLPEQWGTSSCRSYPNRRDWIIKDIPAGEYAVSASAVDDEGKTHFSSSSKLLVQGQH